MDIVFRLKAALFVALVCLSGFAHADITYSISGQTGTDPNAVCQAAYNAQGGSSSGKGFARWVPSQGNFFCQESATSGFGLGYESPQGMCAGGVPVDPQTGLCPVPPPSCPPPGTSLGTRPLTTGFSTGASPNSPEVANPPNPFTQVYCEATCQVTGDKAAAAVAPTYNSRVVQTPGPNGYYRILSDIPMMYIAGTCTDTLGTPAPEDATPEPTAPSTGKDKCPPGTTSGGIDSSGIPICVGTGTVPTTKTTTTAPSTSTVNPDGSTTTTTTVQITNVDGSVTTNTTSVTTGGTNPDGSPKSAATTKGSSTGNTPAGVQGKADPKTPDLCTVHPELNICQNSSVSGDCAATACTGDAIECAALRTARMTYCENHQDNSYSTLGASVAAGTDAPAGGWASTGNAASVDLAASGATLDQSGFLGGGSCFADKSVSVGGKHIVIPFSNMCDYLVPLRLAVMLAALLFSYKMIGGVILRDV